MRTFAIHVLVNCVVAFLALSAANHFEIHGNTTIFLMVLALVAAEPIRKYLVKVNPQQ